MKAIKNKNFSSYELRETVIKGMQEKKALDIKVLNLQNVKNALADFFIICSGTSDTHTNAVADSVMEEVKKAYDVESTHCEGKTNKEWVLVDYLDVVVHVFNKEKRSFYDLENLWGDAEIETISDDVAAGVQTL